VIVCDWPIARELTQLANTPMVDSMGAGCQAELPIISICMMWVKGGEAVCTVLDKQKWLFFLNACFCSKSPEMEFYKISHLKNRSNSKFGAWDLKIPLIDSC
jgi:hypothetical protein